LLDSEATGLIMSSKFMRKQKFKLKKIERPTYVRNVDGSFNKKGPIKYTWKFHSLLATILGLTE